MITSRQLLVDNACGQSTVHTARPTITAWPTILVLSLPSAAIGESARRMCHADMRKPLPRRRTRHLIDFRVKCQGDKRWFPVPAPSRTYRCVPSIVHNYRWVTGWVFPVTRTGYRAGLSTCFSSPIDRFSRSRRIRYAQVVHSNPLNLHKLSTDLSFVDNSERGVQSRSNYYTGCVAHAQPGLLPIGKPRIQACLTQAGEWRRHCVSIVVDRRPRKPGLWKGSQRHPCCIR